MIHILIFLLPPSVIRWCGRLQFKWPWLRRLILRTVAPLTAGESVIRHGVGKGLRFDSRGGYPGYALGTSEPEEQVLLAKLLTPGMVFYDLGANIGFFSTLAARLVGGAGHVYAFEPLPVSAATCSRNANLNAFSHVSVIEAAVSDSSGRMMLFTGESSATHRLGGDVRENGIEVAVVGIDEWRCRTGARLPDVIMIDVEEAEIRVIEGMLETLHAARPTLMVEVHWLGESFAEFFAKKLRPLGYRLSTYAGGAVPTDSVRYHGLLSTDCKRLP